MIKAFYKSAKEGQVIEFEIYALMECLYGNYWIQCLKYQVVSTSTLAVISPIPDTIQCTNLTLN